MQQGPVEGAHVIAVHPLVTALEATADRRAGFGVLLFMIEHAFFDCHLL